MLIFKFAQCEIYPKSPSFLKIPSAPPNVFGKSLARENLQCSEDKIYLISLST